jgi:peptidoglycan/LPS O-acetylase OafA/YrhL
LYVLLFVFFILGGRRSSVLIFIGALCLSIVWRLTPATGGHAFGPFDLYQFTRLGSFFLSGAILAVCWPYIERYAAAIGALALFVVLFAGNILPAATIFRSLAVAAIVIGLGSSRAMAWFSKGGDASYGIYIFAWPLQQFSLLLINSFWLSMLAAFLTTTALGYATWHAFERRAMSSRKRFAETIRNGAEAIRNGSVLKVEPRLPPP